MDLNKFLNLNWIVGADVIAHFDGHLAKGRIASISGEPENPSLNLDHLFWLNGQTGEFERTEKSWGGLGLSDSWVIAYPAGAEKEPWFYILASGKVSITVINPKFKPAENLAASASQD